MTHAHRQDWRKAFHSFSDFRHAPKLTFAIDGILPNEGITLIAGLSGHGKTFIMLEWARLLLSTREDKKLWGHFKVKDVSDRRVIFLTPEISITPFKHRVKKFKLMPHVRRGSLLVHTLSKGPTPELDGERILAAVAGADVFLDPAIRFGEGEESSARDNEEGLAKDLFGLLHAGARSITVSQHSPKKFAKENVMTLENVVRGTGDIGAMASAVWGIKQIDKEKTIIHIECIKARDFKPCGPFQIIGRPSIDQEGHFRMHKEPGECGTLANERSRGGARPEARERKKNKKRLLRDLLEKYPKLTSAELEAKFYKRHKINVAAATIRKYKREIRDGAK
jgi:AAA domain